MEYPEKFEARKRELLAQLNSAKAAIHQANSEINAWELKKAQAKNQEMALLGAIAQLDECLGWDKPAKLDKLSEEETEDAKV